MSDLEKLIAEIEAGLEGVTPGPYAVDNYISKHGDLHGNWGVYEWGEDDPPLAICYEQDQEANAKHFARWSPENTRAILSALSESKAEVERLRAALIWLLSTDYDGRGLTDCVDNDGQHYQSADLARKISAARKALAETGGR